MTNKMIDADALKLWIFNCDSMLDMTLGIILKINELSTPAPEPQKQEIIDFYGVLKGNIEAELVKPLEDSLVGITADNAYIAGLQTALKLADESAKYVIDKLRELPKETK